MSALLLAANVFYLLAFYSVLKIVRDALILSESGAVAASYASAGQALLMLVFVPAYGAFASRVNRVWLVCGVTLFFASTCCIFAVLGLSGVRIGIAFYLWIGVFSMVVVAQFWAFANDLLQRRSRQAAVSDPRHGRQSRRLRRRGIRVGGVRRVRAVSLMLLAAAGLAGPGRPDHLGQSPRAERSATTCRVGRPSSPSADPAGSSWC